MAQHPSPAMIRRRPSLTVTIGIPAAGKSTWARAQGRRTGAAVIGRDPIREQLFGTAYLTEVPITSREQEVTRVQVALVRECLTAGRDVICDDMNLEHEHRAAAERLATECGALFKTHFVDCDLATAIARNRLRGRVVADEVIVHAHNRLHGAAATPLPEVSA